MVALHMSANIYYHSSSKTLFQSNRQCRLLLTTLLFLLPSLSFIVHSGQSWNLENDIKELKQSKSEQDTIFRKMASQVNISTLKVTLPFQQMQMLGSLSMVYSSTSTPLSVELTEGEHKIQIASFPNKYMYMRKQQPTIGMTIGVELVMEAATTQPKKSYNTGRRESH